MIMGYEYYNKEELTSFMNKLYVGCKVRYEITFSTGSYKSPEKIGIVSKIEKHYSKADGICEKCIGYITIENEKNPRYNIKSRCLVGGSGPISYKFKIKEIIEDFIKEEDFKV